MTRWIVAGAMAMAALVGCRAATPDVDADPRLAAPDPSEHPAERRFLSVTPTGLQLGAGDVIEVALSDSPIRAGISCNDLMAGYEIEDGTLPLSDVAVTAMGCPPDETAQDSWLVQLLNSTPSVVLDGPNLTIESALGALHLIDARAPNGDDLPLAGTDWSGSMASNALGRGMRAYASRRSSNHGWPVELRVSCRISMWSVDVDEDAKTVALSRDDGTRPVPPSSEPVHSWRAIQVPMSTSGPAAATMSTTTTTTRPPLLLRRPFKSPPRRRSATRTPRARGNRTSPRRAWAS